MSSHLEKINGFSKWSKEQKLQWVAERFAKDAESVKATMHRFQYDAELQELLDSFSENTLSNFPMPFGIAPHFLINDKEYCVPMVIEESSVVAAASSAAKFWKEKGGFRTEIIGTQKEGQVHFTWSGDAKWLEEQMPDFRQIILDETEEFTQNMRERGGGITGIELDQVPEVSEDCFQLRMSFQTCDSMGANFINSILEEAAAQLKTFIEDRSKEIGKLDVIMSILSNYTPECLVRAEVRCALEDLGPCAGDLEVEKFVQRFKKAVDIAKSDVYRATTHNKGIYNGVDAVVLATGNDFRAVEAAGHAYACRNGSYQSLSDCRVENGYFYFSLEMPIAIGTVGGLTKLHPMAALSHTLLGHPSATELMQIIAAVGLAQNFSALRSLVTEGIQKGHMKMHLNNILNHFEASSKERRKANLYFQDKVVSFRAVRSFLNSLRVTS